VFDTQSFSEVSTRPITDRATGCGGEFLVHATLVQVLCTIGSVLLLLEGNAEDSDWI